MLSRRRQTLPGRRREISRLQPRTRLLRLEVRVFRRHSLRWEGQEGRRIRRRWQRQKGQCRHLQALRMGLIQLRHLLGKQPEVVPQGRHPTSRNQWQLVPGTRRLDLPRPPLVVPPRVQPGRQRREHQLLVPGIRLNLLCPPKKLQVRSPQTRHG